MKKLFQQAKYFIIGLLTLSAICVKGQVTNSIADQAFTGFNNAFIRQDGGLKFYKTSLTNTEKDYFWQQALDIQSAEDSYFRTRAQNEKILISDLLNAFLQQNKSNNTTNVQSWEWNEYNDDLFWATIAFCRGYEHTQDPVFLAQAKYGFNLAYYHTGTGNWGWDNTVDGGIWWSKSMEYKETLSNGPAIVSACYLYQFTGDQDYLNKAKAIYTWLRSKLYDPTTGIVYSKISKTGTVVKTADVFNSGSFGGAANFLYQLTGDINYFNDAKKAFDYVKNTKFNNGVIYATNRNGTENAEYIRWLGEFVRQNNLWNEYYPWMKLNADAAWSKRRTDLNITWNDWRVQSPADNSSTTNESNSAVVMQQVTPVLQSVPNTIQAENYNYMSGIQTETTTDAGGGKNIGYIDSGDWIDYIITVPTAGSYTINYRVAGTGTGSVAFLQNGVTLATTSLPSTGGWQTWATVSATVNLTAGTQSIRLLAKANGWNLNWWSATKANCTATPIVPYVNVGGNWTQAANATAPIGSTVGFGPQPATGGTWSWTGPNGYNSTAREITLANIQSTQFGTYTARYTNACGAQSTQNFTVANTVFQAENAAITNGTTNNGATGQYVDLEGGGKIIWTIPAATAASYTLAFNVGVPAASTRSMGVYVNGTKRGVISSSQVGFGEQSIAVPLNQGNNTVELRDSEGTSELNVDYVKIPTSAARTSAEFDSAALSVKSFEMYPNPVSDGRLTIETNGEQYYSLSIFTTTGRLVYSKQLNDDRSLGIDVGNVLKTGTYIISLKSNRTISTKKLLVK
jgi:hypothetical protein